MNFHKFQFIRFRKEQKKSCKFKTMERLDEKDGRCFLFCGQAVRRMQTNASIVWRSRELDGEPVSLVVRRQNTDTNSQLAIIQQLAWFIWLCTAERSPQELSLESQSTTSESQRQQSLNGPLQKPECRLNSIQRIPLVISATVARSVAYRWITVHTMWLVRVKGLSRITEANLPLVLRARHMRHTKREERQKN